MALHRRRIARVEQRLQHRQIVLEIVDGAVGILRRRPGEARAGFLGRLRGEHAMIGHAAGDRAHHVERVERRHARARFGDVHARIREIQPLGRGADRDLQQQPLGAAAIVLARPGRRRARAGDRRAAADPRAAAAARRARPGRARRRRGTSGRAPDAACRRTGGRSGAPADPSRASPDDRAARRAPPRATPDRRPPSAADRPASAARERAATSACARQRREALDPLAPGRLLGPVGQRVDDRQRELAQVREVARDRARTARCAPTRARRA